MTSSSSPVQAKSYYQFSIRELFAIVLFAAVGIAGLTIGGVTASVAFGASIIFATGIAIIAFVGRDQLRTFAIGFLVPVVAYAVTVLATGKSELDPYEGKLPTTKLIRPLFDVVVKREYLDPMTGKPVANYDPTTNLGGGAGGGYGGGGIGGGFGGIAVGMRETPERETFMLLAHTLLAMICGYAGGKFAVWIDRRQSRQTPIK